MLKCEGYKMFRGKMQISPKTGATPFVVEGVWLYKPEFDCWYANGHSFCADICTIIEDTTE